MAKIRKRGKSYQIDYFDPSGKRVRQAFKKRKDAEAELGKRVSLIAEGKYLDVKKDFKTTLGKLIAKYQENYEQQSSYQTAKRFFIGNFKDHFGEDTRLSNIRYVDLETYRNRLKRQLTHHGKIRTDASTNREMSCFRHMFSKAVEWEMMEQNPFEKGKSLMLKENNKRMRFLTEDEISRLLDECSEYLRDIVECALNTGMRRGELFGLKWDQIRNGFIYLDKTKTNEPRQIPINDDLNDLFRRVRRKQHLTSEHVLNYSVQTKKGLKVRSLSLNDVSTAFGAACKRAGIEDFRFHDLRHTFASQVLLRGGDLKDIQELLGHKTMTMTLRYAHLTQEHKKKAVNLLNGLTTSGKNFDCHKTVTFPHQEKIASL